MTRSHWMRAAAVQMLLLAGGLAATPTLAREAPVAAAASAEAPASDRLGLKDLAMMERVGDPRVSPDGRRVIYAVTTTDWAGNKNQIGLWMVDVDGAAPARRLPISDGGVSGARWAPDGQSIYFMSARGGSNQVWRADRDGMAAAQVTTLPVSVSGFRFTPDGQALVLGVSVYTDCETLDCTKDRLAERAKSTQQVYDRMPLRVFDRWADGRQSHLFLQPLNGSGFAEGQPRDLTAGLDADVGVGESSLTIARDGRSFIYSARKQADRAPFTNDSDLYRLSLDGGAPVNLTEEHSGPDGAPALSPDGRRLAWLAAPRENVGGDQPVVMVADASGANARQLTTWDRGPTGLSWRSDGRALYVTAADEGQNRLFEIDARTGAVKALTDIGSVGDFDEVGDVLAYAHESFTAPTQVFIAKNGQPARQATQHNAELLARIDLPRPEGIRFPGWNDETTHGWVFKPAGYVEGRKYPAVYLIHGGPKSPWTESWSYRWNPQVYTAAGYAVVMVNFHGSPGYGQAFTDAINDHWGDRPLEDLRKGWQAALAANPWIDGERACALGASYGGYMVNMIAGQWNEPWRCLVNHAGVFDVPQLMNAMDISTFIHEFGGPTWDRKAVYDVHNPETYAGDWKKPMLVLHGSRDFRVPMEQGLATFSALQRLNIPSRFVHVPDENHWVLKPQTWVEWQQEILDWTADWTKEGQQTAP
ncbi:prolyl oligopeptidase family serine peptidase [Brevundimonas naejangsanensis]|uniref:dipeptidyl-peptidase 5 n=1 Tax=Brevundimonas naejangsanensis TaxID=588932 RepID=UPI0039F7365C